MHLKKPDRGGRWPTIAPGKEGLVKIFYRDKEIKRPVVIESEEDIEFQPTEKTGESSFEIITSSNRMQVWLHTRFVWGAKYKVRDGDYAGDFIVEAEKMKSEPPPSIELEEVLEEAERMAIKASLNHEEIVRVCYGKISGRVLIAEGIAARPPVDGRIEIVWNSAEKKKQKEKGGRIDPLDRGGINSVEPGEVLAYWHPPLEGAAGKDVFGSPRRPRAPKNARLRVGTGVRLMEEGTIAVAEVGGRPCFERGRLCVRPQLFIPGDVDVSTGNIEFKGDVIVSGDVTESLTIKAGGRVEVKGSVYHAQIIAGGDIVINKSLVGGKVTAGGEIACCMRAAAIIKQLTPALKTMRRAFQQLKRHPNFSTQDLQISGDGYLIKLILEMRFAQIPKLFTKLRELVQKNSGEKSELSKIWQVLDKVSQSFIGANPLNITNISQVDKHLECLNKISAYFEEITQTTADIKVYYCQNVELEATGSIIVSGSLAYGCNMTAGDGIKIAGACRRGTYFANSAIAVDSAGLNETVKTCLAVAEGGTIKAGTLNPGVEVSVGPGKKTIREAKRNIEIKFEHSRWAEKDWK